MPLHVITNSEHAKSWSICTVEEVEDVKVLMKIMALWSTSILVGTTIAILNSFVVLQALSMDRHLGPNFRIPAASFLVFNLIATAISIFFLDRFLLPNLIGRPLTPLQRIGVGHVINVVTMAASALVEARRLHLHDVPMSAPWLLLPLTVLGVGEAFQFPGQVALYYQEFPESLRSTSTAMASLLVGIGYYLSSAIVGCINDGRLDNVFWMNTVVGVVNYGYFLVCANLYKYRCSQ